MSNNSQLAVVQPQQIQQLATKQVNGALKINNIEDLSRLSGMLAKSGFFADSKDAAQCGVKVLAGLEMGFGAFASMTGIHIIKGKPTVGAGLMASKIRSSGKYDYEVLRQDNECCSIAIFEAEFKSDIRNIKRELAAGKIDKKEYLNRVEIIAIGVSSFNADDAKKAGTQNMEKFARNMLFARAVSNAVKWYCPDIFDVGAVYTPEEMGATVDEDGYIIESVPRQQVAIIEQPLQQSSLESSFDTATDNAEQRAALSNAIGKHKQRLSLDVTELKKISHSRYNKQSSVDLTLEQLDDFAAYLANQNEKLDIFELA
jgi:hypothetical protein